MSQTDPLGEGEFAVTPQWLRNPAGSNATAVNSPDIGIVPSELQPKVDINSDAVFAAMADSDLSDVSWAFLDEVIEALRTATSRTPVSSSPSDVDFYWYSPKDERSDLAKARETRPFRKGFVDIGESVDELFSEQATTRQAGEGDLRESQDDSTADSTAEQGEGDRVPIRDILWLRRAIRLAFQGARDPETTTGEQPNQSAARDGMVRLAHSGNLHADGLPDRACDATPPLELAPSYLKMDGAVVRYQAFEVAPVRASDDSEPPITADSEAHEPSLPGNTSTAASDRSSLPPARAFLAPAILAFLWRHRSRRRDAQS